MKVIGDAENKVLKEMNKIAKEENENKPKLTYCKVCKTKTASIKNKCYFCNKIKGEGK